MKNVKMKMIENGKDGPENVYCINMKIRMMDESTQYTRKRNWKMRKMKM